LSLGRRDLCVDILSCNEAIGEADTAGWRISAVNSRDMITERAVDEDRGQIVWDIANGARRLGSRVIQA
jgi:hypothetical protein